MLCFPFGEKLHFLKIPVFWFFFFFCEIPVLSNTVAPITLHMVHPAVVGIGQNAPVLQLPSDALMQTCDTVVKYPIPCVFYRSLKCLKFPHLNLVP